MGDKKQPEKEVTTPLVELPTDTPELENIPLGARAMAAATNRLYGSF